MIKRHSIKVLAGSSAAEIDFDEIEIALAEEKAAIFVVVTQKSHLDAHLVVVIVAAARVFAAVRIDARLESERVDVVGDAFESL